MAEGTGFTVVPTYPAYGVDPSTTAFPEATTTSDPVASNSVPRWYAADYHHPLRAMGAYVDVPGYATLSGLRRGPESCGSRSRGLRRPSNRSLTQSEIREALRGANCELVGDLTLEIRAKLEPLIPHQASLTIVGVSPHQVQADHSGKPEEPTDADACCDTEKPFHTKNGPASLQPRGEFHESQAGPARAESPETMVDVEPYGSSDLGGDSSDDEPPSSTSAPPSEDDDPEDKHSRKPEEPTDAHPCCDTEKPFHTKNGPASLQPCGEFHESRAGPAGADSPETMVEEEPYHSSDLGADPSDDKPPSLTSASPSEDNDPEDPENPSGRKKKKKRKTKRPEGRRSQ